MKNYTHQEIHDLIERFESRKLPKLEWTHEAHIVVALWYCSKYSFKEALNHVREKIRKHNESVGTENTDTEGYHETITKFWLLVASDFLRKTKHLSIEDKCNAMINSEFGKSSYPLDYYSRQLLFSTTARHCWVKPDLNDFEVNI